MYSRIGIQSSSLIDQVHTQAPAAGAHATRADRARARTAEAVQLRLDEACSDERCTLEAQIAERFANQYSARLSHFLPLLLSLRQNEYLTTVVGLRPAGREDLYLERYLDSPVEQAVSRVAQVPVERDALVEIGNLVSVKRGASYLLFAVLATTLHRAGFQWVVCTATRQIQAMLGDMGFRSMRICKADVARVQDMASDWGSYYDAQPEVITGNLQDAADLMAANPALSELLDALEPQINAMAEQLGTRA